MRWHRQPKGGHPRETQQIRRILLKEGVRWRQTHSWGTPRDKDFVQKNAVVSYSRATGGLDDGSRTDELGQ